MLEIQSLQTHYGTSHIIQGVDLTVRDGEVFGIFGRNGVGKTTLLKAIAGWIKPTSGTIKFDRERIDTLAPDRIARRGIGFVPEDRRIFPGLTVEENLTLGLLQVPRGTAAGNRAALQAIYDHFPRLFERRRQYGTTLSGGEQQMLAMARVMIGNPRLILIDEPSEGLAPMIVSTLYSIIDNMKKSGCSIILVEQNVHQALKVCDQFAAVSRGTIAMRGHADDRAACDELLATIAV